MIRGLYCKKKLEIRCQSVSRRLSVYFLSRYFQILGIFVGIDHHFTQDKTGFIIACLLSISVSATKNWHKPLQDRDRLWWQFGDFMFSLIKKKDNWKMCKVLKHTERTLVLRLYSIHFEINGNPWIWLAPIGTIYSRILSFLASFTQPVRKLKNTTMNKFQENEKQLL